MPKANIIVQVYSEKGFSEKIYRKEFIIGNDKNNKFGKIELLAIMKAIRNILINFNKFISLKEKIKENVLDGKYIFENNKIALYCNKCRMKVLISLQDFEEVKHCHICESELSPIENKIGEKNEIA